MTERFEEIHRAARHRFLSALLSIGEDQEVERFSTGRFVQQIDNLWSLKDELGRERESIVGLLDAAVRYKVFGDFTIPQISLLYDALYMLGAEEIHPEDVSRLIEKFANANIDITRPLTGAIA